jgi:hypothetical protein
MNIGANSISGEADLRPRDKKALVQLLSAHFDARPAPFWFSFA